MIDYRFLLGMAWKHLAIRRPLANILIPSPQEPSVDRYVRNVRGRCFIDVGANVGMYSIRYRNNFDRVYAIEPHPDTVKVLRAKMRMRFTRNVTVLDFAASDTDGKTNLFLDGTVGRSAGSADTIEPEFTYRPASSPNLTVHYPSGNRGKRTALVETRRLDSYPFPYPNLVKIDVEGAEFRVLAGAKETLRGTERLIVELHDRERSKELEELVSSTWGFRTRWIAPDHLLGEKS